MSRAATARLFVALDLPPLVSERLAAWARTAVPPTRAASPSADAPALRPLDPELLHLTLAFLSNRPVEDIDPLVSALASSPATAIPLAVGPPLWLPTRHPRALAVALGDPDRQLEPLHARVLDSVAAAIPWEPERRRYRPHVTVARLRGGRRSRASSIPSAQLPPTPRLSFSAEALTLYRSWLSPSGPTYEPVESFALPEDPGGSP